MSDEEPKIEVAGHLKSDSDFVQARTVLSSEGIPTAEGEKPIDVPKAKLRIRYLTPRECLRLMDFTDEQIDRLFAVEKSKSQLYKMAGNSIVVGVLVAIFKSIYIDETFAKPVKRVRLEDFL